MQWFEATIEANSLESAMNLPGWSHCGPPFERQVMWYPWKATFRKIYFKSKHRRQAAKDLDKVGVLGRDLSEGRPIKSIL